MSELLGFDFELDEQEERSQSAKKEEKPTKLPYHVWTVGGKEYKLKLTAKEIMQVEQKFKGKSILDLISNGNGVPGLAIMLTIVQGSMVKYQSNIDSKTVMSIYDQYCQEGGSLMDLLTEVIFPTLSVSGFFSTKQSEKMMDKLEEVQNSLD